MPISFTKLQKGRSYSRQRLANLWGYQSYHAIARGVVTPKNDNKIVLFVTELKQRSAEPYVDQLHGNVLRWEGPRDHFAEDRIQRASSTGDEIHVFYRRKHHSDFEYLGPVAVIAHRSKGDSNVFDLRLSYRP